jgi:hypothetical protein
MGLIDALKDRFSANLKLTRLSFMSQPQQIVTFCRALTPAERTAILRGIESQFKWQSVARVAQAMFPSYTSGSGVSAEALDMVQAGHVSAGVELMRMQNQAAPPLNWGMLPAQQAALSFAWIVLKGLEQHEAAPAGHAAAEGAPSTRRRSPTHARHCASCGARKNPGLYCVQCGTRF